VSTTTGAPTSFGDLTRSHGTLRKGVGGGNSGGSQSVDSQFSLSSSPSSSSSESRAVHLLREAERGAAAAAARRGEDGVGAVENSDDGVQRQQPPSKLQARSQQRTQAALEQHRNKQTEKTGARALFAASASPDFIPDEGVISAAHGDDFSDV
jgi:hypothetical protein